jgi:CDP-Glycerol:Poly(glycerophosphate) glycerophosphotransferase
MLFSHSGKSPAVRTNANWKRIRKPNTARVAPDDRNWHTLGVKRTVLFAAHTPTSLDRLEDLAPLLDTDDRIQLRYTQVPDSLGDGVDQRLRDLEVSVVPWSEATERPVDLVVGASLHRLEDIPATKRFAVPHGAGYNKVWPAWARPMMGGARPVYGLDRRSLLDGRGRPVLDALMLPHPEHLATLRRQCPEVVDIAVVAGDPCYDRLVASMANRDRYRERLGVRGGQVLVVAASTWGPHSLLASQRDLLRRLPRELPANHRVIATMHPAVWSAHGVRSVRQLLRDVRETGVDLADAWEDWRGLVAAADVLIADHSSLSVYAAGVGVPVLLSHFPAGEVDPGSVLAGLAAHSPRLRQDQPLFGQVLAARDARPNQLRAVHDRLAARAGKSAEIIRETLYRLLELPEPAAPARWPLVTAPALVQDERPVAGW